jgi:RNA polymerase sigma-70 factor (ECF subfamily)
MYPDEQLMIKVKNGHLSEMSGLFDRYHVKIYNFFRKMQLDKGLSEDLTQNVFERALKYRQTFKDDYVFRSWIYRIASNVKNDHFRALKKSRSTENELKRNAFEMQTYTIDNHPSDRNEYLNQALKLLTPDQRELIWLTKYENMKYSEVGDLLGYSEANIKIRIHRAIKSLKTQYFKVEQNELRR